MRQALDRLYRWSGYLAAFFILAICLVVMAQVTLNIIDQVAIKFTGSAIGLTIPSYSDFTGFFLAAASFLALAYTLREGGHIRVTLFLHILPVGLRRVLDLWSVAFAAMCAGYLSYYAVRLTHESFTYGDLSSGIVPVPLWIPQSAMTLGVIILAIALLDELIGQLRGQMPTYEGKGENLLAETEEVIIVGKSTQQGEHRDV